jgi:peptidoglycan hydrolase CwlO-like protein
MTNSQTALTLKQEIEYIKELAERFHSYDGCDGVEYGVSEKAMKVIGKLQEIIGELQSDIFLLKNKLTLQEKLAEVRAFQIQLFQVRPLSERGDKLDKENQALLAKNEELEDELETRRAFIVANPCAQCGGKINAMKCGAWHARAKELEEKYAKLKKSFDEISHVKQVVFKLQNELEDKQEEIEELNKKLSGE